MWLRNDDQIAPGSGLNRVEGHPNIPSLIDQLHSVNFQINSVHEEFHTTYATSGHDLQKEKSLRAYRISLTRVFHVADTLQIHYQINQSLNQRGHAAQESLFL